MVDHDAEFGGEDEEAVLESWLRGINVGNVGCCA